MVNSLQSESVSSLLVKHMGWNLLNGHITELPNFDSLKCEIKTILFLSL